MPQLIQKLLATYKSANNTGCVKQYEVNYGNRKTGRKIMVGRNKGTWNREQ
jgi:hypothetical protein